MFQSHPRFWQTDASSEAHSKLRFVAHAQWQNLDLDKRVLKAYSKCTAEIQDKKSKFHLSK